MTGHDQTEKPVSVSFHGNMEKLVTMYNGGKYFAVAKEEGHKGKKKEDSEKERCMKDRTLSKGWGEEANQKQNIPFPSSSQTNKAIKKC